MKVSVVGTGYVGLVTGTCFAELGNEVTCVDIDQQKVDAMKQGQLPIHEPGLQELFDRNVKEGRLQFTTDLKETLGSAAIFLALPTPPDEDGSADLSYVLGVADELGKEITDYTVIVDKSTVPAGTAQRVKEQVSANAKTEFDVVSNPEFLREGQAVNDFLRPDRVVIGTSSHAAETVMRKLYSPLVRQQPERLIVTDEVTAELSKYAANGFLAAKISWINSLTSLCDTTGANIDDIRAIMGTDSRIGREFLYAGPGYGGSCFPKDTLALRKMAEDAGLELPIVDGTIKVNETQKQVVPKKVMEYFDGDVEDKVFALWGLAFKDNTDDVRESPAIAMINTLTEAGAHIVAFDPQATDNAKRALDDNTNVTFAENEYDMLENADALIIATNWKEFSTPDYDRIKASLKAPVIFDSRNLYSLEDMQELGFYYQSIGRPLVNPYE